jgi:hypothetical protein
MVKGLNSDLIIRGKKFHIQTEDWGRENPFLVTKVFCDGAVLRTIKTPYTALTQTSMLSQGHFANGSFRTTSKSC